jgi:hypothetical protein
LHQGFANWLEQRDADLVELDEILGYHLEQAYSCLVELGRPGDRGQRLAEQAAERLSAAGGGRTLAPTRLRPSTCQGLGDEAVLARALSLSGMLRS